jgi:hypothetical protein
MTITTAEGALAGMKQPRFMVKNGTSTVAVAAAKLYSTWYAPGSPGASLAPTAGLTGQPYVSTDPTYTGSSFPRTNPVSGNSYIGRFSVSATNTGTAILADRIWANNGISPTATTLQTINSSAFPGRDLNGTANGEGYFCAIEWVVNSGAGTPTYTLIYTNSANVPNRTTTLVSAASPRAGTFELFDLQDGDTGIKSIQSIQANATHTSGTLSLVVYRPLLMLEVPAINTACSVDFLTSGFPRLWNDTVLQLLWFPSTTTATTFIASYVETQG